MPRYGVRTYGRPGQQDSAAQAFDSVVSTSFSSVQESRKRKVEDGAEGDKDPFSFDSDDDGSPKKRAAAASGASKPVAQPKKIIITSTTVRKNAGVPLKTVGNNDVGKVTAITASPGTKTVLIKTVSGAVKPVTGTVVKSVTGTMVKPVTGTVVKSVAGTVVKPVTGTMVKAVTGTVLKPATGTVVKSGAAVKTVVRPVTATLVKKPVGTTVVRTVTSPVRPVTDVRPVTTIAVKPVTNLVSKTVAKPSATAVKSVTTTKGKTLITTTTTVAASKGQLSLDTYVSASGTSKNGNNTASYSQPRKFFTLKTDHTYSQFNDSPVPSPKLSELSDSAIGTQSSVRSQTASSSQRSTTSGMLSTILSQGGKSTKPDSSWDIEFDSDEEIESGDPEIIFNSPKKKEQARLKRLALEKPVSSPGSRSATDSPITISDEDRASPSPFQKNGTHFKTYGRSVTKPEGRKPLLMGKSLSLDGRLTKPPSLESKTTVRKSTMQSAKSLPIEGCFSSKHALTMDSSKPVLISYSRKSKADDEGKEPAAKRLLSGAKKSAAVYNPRQWHSDGSPDTSSSPDTAISVSSKTASPFDLDNFDDDVTEIKPPSRPPLLRRKTAANHHSPMFDEPDEVTKVQITREHKPLYTVVRNVKQAHEVQEHGETQDFEDDLEYIMSGLTNTHNVSIRCLSTISLVSKCMMPSFRMHLRAHSTLTKVFSALNDSPKHPTLALCTAAVLYMLSRDRMTMELEKSILKLMVELLSMDTQQNGTSNSDYIRTEERIRSICQKAKDEGSAEHLDIEEISTGSLAMESLLSMTSKRAGDWFKEELRKLGGLDHIINTVSECIDDLDEFVIDPSEAMLSRLMKIERCLRVLDNVTYLNKENQNYLITYNSSQLIQSLCRTLKVCENCLPFNAVPEDNQGNYDKDCTGAVVFRSSLSVLRVLLNLTHDSDRGSAEVGLQCGLVRTILTLILQVPQYVPTKLRFDLLVLSLGVLINMAEHCDTNRQQLIRTKVPQSYELAVRGEDAIALDALVQLFVSRLDAAKKTEEEQEEMKKQRRAEKAEKAAKEAQKAALEEPELFSEHPSQDVSGEWHESDSGLEWVIMPENHKKSSGSKRTKNGPLPTASDDESDSENDLELLASQGEENEDFTKALHKAGKHMEDSIVCAYISLLVGCVIQSNPDCVDRVRGHLSDGNFEPMVIMLKKFLGFMNLTTATGSTAGKSIRRVIDILEAC